MNEEVVTSRGFRQLRRNLANEMDMNAKMLYELKLKDKEINGLYSELDDMKATCYKSNTNRVSLERIKTVLTSSSVANAYGIIDKNTTSAENLEEVMVIHKIIALRNELQNARKEAFKQKVSQSSLDTSNSEAEDLNQHGSHLQNGNDELKERLVIFERENENVQKKMEILLAENIGQREELQKKAKETDELEADLQAHRKEVILYRDRQEAACVTNSNLKKELEMIKNKLLELQQEVIELQEENDQLHTDTDLLQASTRGEMQQIEDENASIGNKISANLTSLEKLRIEYESCKREDVKLKAELSRIQSELLELQEELKNIKAENIILQEDFENSKNEVNNLHIQVNSFRRNKVLMTDEINKVKLDNNNLLEELHVLKAQCEEMQKVLDSSNEENDTIKEELNRMKSQKSKIVRQTDEKANKKINEMKDKFKEALQHVMDALKDRAELPSKKYFASSTSSSVINNTSSSDSDKSPISSAERVHREKVDESSLAYQVMTLVSQLADEIFSQQGSVKLDIPSEMEIVTKIESLSNSSISARSLLSVTSSSGKEEDVLTVLQRGLKEVKTLSKSGSKSKVKSTRVKRKHEVLDEMLNIVDKIQVDRGFSS